MALVEAGIQVAGRSNDGPEVFITKSVETNRVQRPVQKQVCEPEYDYLEGDYVTKCKFKTVYEDATEKKTSYVVSGLLSTRQPNVYGAFAQAAAVGANTFRRAN